MKAIFLTIASLGVLLNATAQDDWELEKETDKAKVWTKTVEESDVKAYKMVAEIDREMTCAVNVMTDFDKYPEIIPEISELEVINEEPGVSSDYYAVFELPWPFDDRDAVTHVDIEHLSEKKIRILSTASTDDLVEEKEDYVRMNIFREEMIFEDLGDGRCKLTVEGLFDMGGSVPTWVQNLFIVDAPFATIETIEKNCPSN